MDIQWTRANAAGQCETILASGYRLLWSVEEAIIVWDVLLRFQRSTVWAIRVCEAGSFFTAASSTTSHSLAAYSGSESYRPRPN